MIILIVAAIGALALGVARFLAPPDVPPEYRGQRPEPIADGHITHRESILIDVPVGRYMEWVTGTSLEDVLQGSDDVPSVVRTEPVMGTWGEVGARRRVVLDDGHYVTEEILENDQPRIFRYEVWGYTNAGRLMIEYAVGEFKVDDEDGQTLVTWTYSFHPTVGIARPVLSSFVEGTWADFMRSVLTTYKVEAERYAQATAGE